MTAADRVTLREWRRADINAVASYANNRKLWINMRDRLPYPYTCAHARAWIAHCAAQTGPATQFAIDLDGSAVGAIGFERFSDVHRLGAEIGYWVGEPFWGKGIATAAVIRATEYGFATLGLVRIQAMVFEWNMASARVLEKVGYVLEGRMRRSIIKDGRIADSLL
jgi:RimJ/RimL family protein N-acetyltransferase